MTATDNLTDRLAEIRARAEAATEGPWETRGCQCGCSRSIACGNDPDILSGRHGMPLKAKENATFIAHARQDVPTLLAALEAVVALHVPMLGAPYDACSECSGDEFALWPCPTITAITNAMEVE